MLLLFEIYNYYYYYLLLYIIIIIIIIIIIPRCGSNSPKIVGMTWK